MVALNPELEEVIKIINRWFERYKEEGDEMAVEMFVDDLEYAEPYVRRLFDMGLITAEEYWQFLKYCDSLVEELKRIAGIEKIDFRFR
uniref:Uncharacterized protein n=1 Tax=Geoglobus ahangari TaxID=113653 RepID=A0A7C4WD50_9EURY